jgi:hypothetical protein
MEFATTLSFPGFLNADPLWLALIVDWILKDALFPASINANF